MVEITTTIKAWEDESRLVDVFEQAGLEPDSYEMIPGEEIGTTQLIITLPEDTTNEFLFSLGRLIGTTLAVPNFQRQKR